MKLIKKRALADFCGVSRSAITQAVKSQLKDAIVNNNVIMDHPLTKKYILKKRKNYNDFLNLENGVVIIDDSKQEIVKKNTSDIQEKDKTLFKDENLKKTNYKRSVIAFSKENKFSKKEPEENNINDFDHNIEAPRDVKVFLDFTLREIISQFGNKYEFETWLKSTQIIATINEKNLKNAITEGKVISRDLVKSCFFDPLNATLLKLMSDGSKNLTATIISKHLSGFNSAQIEKITADIIGSFVKPMKVKMKRNINKMYIEESHVDEKI